MATERSEEGDMNDNVAFELGMRSYAQYRDMNMTLRVMRHRRKVRNAAEREAFRIGWTMAAM